MLFEYECKQCKKRFEAETLSVCPDCQLEQVFKVYQGGSISINVNNGTGEKVKGFIKQSKKKLENYKQELGEKR